MNWACLVLGNVEVVAADPRGVLVAFGTTLSRLPMPRNLIRLVPAGDTFVAEETEQPARRGSRGGLPWPFERTSLGTKSRLAWPKGATTMGPYAQIAGWKERFAIVLDDRGFSVIDAESDRIVRLVLPPKAIIWAVADPIVSVDRVWLGSSYGVISIPTATLETLTASAVDITFVRHYPARKPEARLDCVFLWFLQNGKAMVEIGDGKGGANEPKLTIDMPNLSLQKYSPVTLVDELYPWHFAALEATGRERVSISNATNPTHPAKITVSRAKDPTEVPKPTASALPQARASAGALERLVAAVVANPADDAQRAVLADLLLELGDPSAEAIAKLRAGKESPATVKDALGPLGLYLTKVDHVGGFPVAATITRDAPSLTEHAAELDAACADFRLGLIHSLHSQPGRRASPQIYARLIGAPVATSLRRVDVSHESAIAALIAANRDQLEYFEYVDFAEAEWMERLAAPMFDRVTTVHTVVGLAHLQPLMNRLTRDKSKFFKRARRKLVLDETRDRHAELLRAFGEMWAKLPLAALSIGGVTIERDGPITGDDAQLVAVARGVFAG